MAVSANVTKPTRTNALQVAAKSGYRVDLPFSRECRLKFQLDPARRGKTKARS
jgi:hypothetical protein